MLRWLVLLPCLVFSAPSFAENPRDQYVIPIGYLLDGQSQVVLEHRKDILQLLGSSLSVLKTLSLRQPLVVQDLFQWPEDKKNLLEGKSLQFVLTDSSSLAIRETIPADRETFAIVSGTGGTAEITVFLIMDRLLFDEKFNKRKDYETSMVVSLAGMVLGPVQAFLEVPIEDALRENGGLQNSSDDHLRTLLASIKFMETLMSSAIYSTAPDRIKAHLQQNLLQKKMLVAKKAECAELIHTSLSPLGGLN